VAITVEAVSPEAFQVMRRYGRRPDFSHFATRLAAAGRIPGVSKPGRDWVFEPPIEVLPPARPPEWPRMQRANTGEGDRRDFHLYIDEFQNVTTDSFRSILSEARKYRLCLALGHQYISQLPEALHSAVFGNVGTMIALWVGNEDA
jgi:hypothetical protein